MINLQRIRKSQARSGRKAALIFLAAIIIIALIGYSFLFQVTGTFPIQFDKNTYWDYSQAYGDSVSTIHQAFTYGSCVEGAYYTASDIGMPIGYGFSQVDYFGIGKFVTAELGRNGGYKIVVNHADYEKLTTSSYIWENEKQWMNKENPYNLTITYTSSETLENGDVKVTEKTITYWIYRFFTRIDFDITGDKPDVRVYSGLVNPSESIELALGQINAITHEKNGRVVVQLSVPSLCIESNTDWFGFLGAWVSQRTEETWYYWNTASIGASACDISPSLPHEAVGIYEDPQLTRPANRAFHDFPSLSQYDTDEIINAVKGSFSSTVYLGFNINDFGVSYQQVFHWDWWNYNADQQYGYASPTKKLFIVYDLISVTKPEFFNYIIPGPGTTTGVIYGNVRDGTFFSLIPLGGVEVNTEGGSAVTDGGGNYRIENLDPGVYTVTFSAPWRETRVASAQVIAGMETRVDASLPLAGIVGVIAIILIFLIIGLVAIIFVTRIRIHIGGDKAKK